ncbi:hypothetical protein J6590_012768 [Homalodisca vitripennis]|nr:hypothetical protein J6590_012768 [Homalodisca vitripennis]
MWRVTSCGKGGRGGLWCGETAASITPHSCGLLAILELKEGKRGLRYYNVPVASDAGDRQRGAAPNTVSLRVMFTTH